MVVWKLLVSHSLRSTQFVSKTGFECIENFWVSNVTILVMSHCRAQCIWIWKWSTPWGVWDFCKEACRNKEKGEEAAAEIVRNTNNPSIRYHMNTRHSRFTRHIFVRVEFLDVRVFLLGFCCNSLVLSLSLHQSWNLWATGLFTSSLFSNVICWPWITDGHLGRVMSCDLASLTSVRQFAKEYLDQGLPLNSLVSALLSHHYSCCFLLLSYFPHKFLWYLALHHWPCTSFLAQNLVIL